jgi:hypothetical protein
VLPKTKKVVYSNFPFQSHFFEKVFCCWHCQCCMQCIHTMFLLPINQPEFATATLEKKSFCKFDFFKCLLHCAEYLLSAEYSAAFSCRIFVFVRNKKIRFRSITSAKVTLFSSYAAMHGLWESRNICMGTNKTFKLGFTRVPILISRNTVIQYQSYFLNYLF